MDKTDIVRQLQQEHGGVFVGKDALEKYAPTADALSVRVVSRYGGHVMVCQMSYREKVSGRERDFHTPILQLGCTRGERASAGFLQGAELVLRYVHHFNAHITLKDRTNPERASGIADPRARLAALLK